MTSALLCYLEADMVPVIGRTHNCADLVFGLGRVPRLEP